MGLALSLNLKKFCFWLISGTMPKHMLNLEILFIAFFAILGFGVSLKINHKKRETHPFVCPIGFDCDAVVKSQYGTFLGVNVEKWGMTYYSLVAIFYIGALFYPALSASVLGPLVIGLSGGAFFFSIYLTLVQAFLLKSWCSYCLFSALLSTLIFFVSLAQLF